MVNKNQQLILTIVFTITLLAPAITQSNATAQTNTDSFSIMWITDTQYLSESHPALFNNLCNWILQNNATYNIKMVVHTGDLVNQEGNRTQWLNANQSMGMLLDGGVPYTWDAGNHDYNDTYYIGNQYAAFNPQVMESKQYWVSQNADGLSTAVHFNAMGQDWLIVNVAFEADKFALTWANNSLDANPQAHAIVATHAYLNRAGEYDSWETKFKNQVLDTHTNVFLTLSGHYHPTSGVRTRIGERDELLFNQQNADNYIGAESARILTLNTAQKTITVQTYSLYLNQFIDDSDNSFTLSTSFRNESAGGSGFQIALAAAVLIVVLCLVIVAVFFVKRRFKR